MSINLINTWLAPLASAVGAPLALDDQGVAGIELDNDLVCTIEFDAQSELLYLHSALIAIPADDVAGICQRAMVANLYGLGTGGATLGFDAVRSQLVASQSFPLAALTGEAFLIHLQSFVASLLSLRQQFR